MHAYFFKKNEGNDKTKSRMFLLHLISFSRPLPVCAPRPQAVIKGDSFDRMRATTMRGFSNRLRSFLSTSFPTNSFQQTLLPDIPKVTIAPVSPMWIKDGQRIYLFIFVYSSHHAHVCIKEKERERPCHPKALLDRQTSALSSDRRGQPRCVFDRSNKPLIRQRNATQGRHGRQGTQPPTPLPPPPCRQSAAPGSARPRSTRCRKRSGRRCRRRRPCRFPSRCVRRAWGPRGACCSCC